MRRYVTMKAQGRDARTYNLHMSRRGTSVHLRSYYSQYLAVIREIRLRSLPYPDYAACHLSKNNTLYLSPIIIEVHTLSYESKVMSM